jgi:hypothetical protein
VGGFLPFRFVDIFNSCIIPLKYGRKGSNYRAVYYYGISVIVPDFSFKIRITDLPLGITLPGFVPTFFILLGRVSALSRMRLIFQFKKVIQRH